MVAFSGFRATQKYLPVVSPLYLFEFHHDLQVHIKVSFLLLSQLFPTFRQKQLHLFPRPLQNSREKAQYTAGQEIHEVLIHIITQ